MWHMWRLWSWLSPTRFSLHSNGHLPYPSARKSMSVAIITGSSGLVGSEAAAYFTALGFDVVGIDNGMREVFFGQSASTHWMTHQLQKNPPGYAHYDLDIRDPL